MNCKTCSGPLDDVTKKNCESCREKNRLRRQAQRRKNRKPREKRVTSGKRCSGCRTSLEESYAFKTCEGCRAKSKRPKICNECEETVSRLRGGQCARCLGVCTKCFAVTPEGDTWVCAACRTKSAESRKARRKQRSEQEGICNECGKASNTTTCDDCRARNAQHYQNSQRKRMRDKAKQLVAWAQQDATQRRVPCTIGTWFLADLLIPGICQRTGESLELDPFKDEPNSPRLLMLNPKLGYIEDNVIVVTKLNAQRSTLG